MKTAILSALLTLGALGAGAAAPQTGSSAMPGYTLVWEDLFDSASLDPESWNIEEGNNNGANNELQYYTKRPVNVSVGDDGRGNGCLILTARREDYINRNFTSGRVNTLGKRTFTHGKVEASIRLPKTANGLWPAFWMMGNDITELGWPRCGETDIMEMGHGDGIAAGTHDRLFNGALHWANADGSHAQFAGVKTNSYNIQDGEFHLFTLIWDESEIRMYLDLDRNPSAEPYLTMKVSEGELASQFHKPGFILFNLAVGGDFPGIHDADGVTALNDGNSQSQSMFVNYVKVYEKTSEMTLNTEK